MIDRENLKNVSRVGSDAGAAPPLAAFLRSRSSLRRLGASPVEARARADQAAAAPTAAAPTAAAAKKDE